MPKHDPEPPPPVGPDEGLRILHVTPSYERAWAYGGVPRVAAAIARAQARAGHRVEVLTTDARDRERRLTTEERADHPDGVRVTALANWSNRVAYDWQLYLPRGVRTHTRRLVAAADVVHVHGHHHLLGVAAAGACRRAGVPWVITPNGTAPRFERRRFAKWVFDRIFGERALFDAAAVAAVSQAERNELVGLGVEASRLAVVPNPVRLAELDEAASVRETESGRVGESSRPRVGFLGKITPRKGVRELVHAIAAAETEASLVVAGNEMATESGVAELAAGLGVGDRVTVLGLLTGKGRLDLLAACDLVVYAGSREIFGLVPLEAILCGTPVIVADDSGCGEVIGELGGPTVPPHDVEALAGAIDRVLSDLPAWTDWAVRTVAVVRSRYGDDTVAATCVALYRSVLEEPR